MTQLHQILAIGKTMRPSAETSLTVAYHQLGKPGPFLGLVRRYKPLNETDGPAEQLPDEQTRVQTTVGEQIEAVRNALTRLFDITAVQEWTNCVARADVVINGEVVIPNAPVTYLLFLERKLTDLKTFVSKLPVLDASETWTYDTEAGYYRTPPTKTMRTKKVPRNHEKAPATDKHPAQVEMYYEDTPVGTWEKVQFSGMIPETDRKALVTRVENMQAAVKAARAAANTVDVIEISPGPAFFNYIFPRPA